MNVHISYKLRKTPDLEKEIHHLVEKLRKRLQVFRPELLHLKGVVEQNAPRKGITISLNLRLPSGQMAVQQSAQTPVAAIKSAFDDLLQQITRHKDLLRSSHKWRQRRRSANSRPETQVAFEQTIAAVQPSTISADDIRSYVNANLSRLERFVERIFRGHPPQGREDRIGPADRLPRRQRPTSRGPDHLCRGDWAFPGVRSGDILSYDDTASPRCS